MRDSYDQVEVAREILNPRPKEDLFDDRKLELMKMKVHAHMVEVMQRERRIESFIQKRGVTQMLGNPSQTSLHHF